MSNTNESFLAIPTSGKTPLTVHFTIAGGRGNYRLEFGDGQVVGPAICMEGSFCSPKYTISHTYTSAGTFVARLTRASDGFQVGTATVSATETKPGFKTD